MKLVNLDLEVTFKKLTETMRLLNFHRTISVFLGGLQYPVLRGPQLQFPNPNYLRSPRS